MAYKKRQLALRKVIEGTGLHPIATACGISVQAVSQWPEVPPKHVLTVEKITGVSRYALRPDIYGKRP